MPPTSTYRLQLHAEFGFRDAERITPYLHDLGVTDLYSSPVFTAREGSTHGYDVTDPTALSPELGGEEGFLALSDALLAHSMGLVMDIVPNHMAASVENAWWLSVLENGRSSEFANYFDIVWEPGNPTADSPLASKVLLPILGSHYGNVLESQELQVGFDEHGFHVNYWETRLPLDPKTYRFILEQRYSLLMEQLGTDRQAQRDYEHLIERCDELPDRLTTDLEAIEIRRRGTGELKAEIWALYNAFPAIQHFIDENLGLINGVKGQPETFDLLDRLLTEQPYRLAFWRVASNEINYRRFFDVADLVSMRIEDPEVFEARHRPLRAMVADGRLTGLRIDHIDGLHDPQAYLQRLQEFIHPPGTFVSTEPPRFYVAAEKILAEGENLRTAWPCDGTTGYDFLNLVNGLFIDNTATRQLDDIYRRVSGVEASFEEIVYDSKRRVMAELFPGDVRSLISRLDRLSLWDRHGRDLTLREIGQALYEIIARFDVYRTYIRDFEIADKDRARIEHAVDTALERRPELGRAFRFIRRVLLLQFPVTLPESEKAEWLAFIMRWQQSTSPIMAKGHEDTALYIYHRLTSANDVGGEPGTIGVSVAEFHTTNAHRGATWPHTMNDTSTHDTKRSEDVRARINVISEMPDAWGECVERWRDLNASARQTVGDMKVPDGNTEYLIYQTLVGAWPLDDGEPSSQDDFRERIKQYLMKATRESKVHTSWINPIEEYETGINAFVDGIFANQPFMDDFRTFQNTIGWHGALNSLSQVLLKGTSPGIPDFYQGTELWDLSLVDPDNRRPVDYTLRRRLLDDLQGMGDITDTQHLLSHWKDGAIKLHVVRTILTLRRDNRELFLDGEYLPLEVNGQRRDHVVAFARHQGNDWFLTIAPRLTAILACAAGLPIEEPLLGEPAWGDTTVVLPPDAPAAWHDALTGDTISGELRLGAVLGKLPLALLQSS